MVIPIAQQSELDITRQAPAISREAVRQDPKRLKKYRILILIMLSLNCWRQTGLARTPRSGGLFHCPLNSNTCAGATAIAWLLSVNPFVKNSVPTTSLLLFPADPSRDAVGMFISPADRMLIFRSSWPPLQNSTINSHHPTTSR